MPLPHRFTTAALAATLWLSTTGFSLPRTTEQDPSLPSIELNGYRFHAEAFGDPGKPVLIVLHGGPGADYRYLTGLQALSDEYRVVFYDQRGTGLSPRVPKEQISLAGFVDDLDAFVDSFGQGRPVHLLGHSWGAMLASTYTGAHPQKVARLVLAEPGFLDQETRDVFDKGGWPGWRLVWGFAKAWMGKWLVDTDGDPYARDDYFLQQVMPLTQGPEEMCEGRLPPLMAWRFGSPSFDATMGRMMSDPAYAKGLDFRQGLDKFDGHALLLAGACNQVTGPTHQARHLKHFAHATLQVVPNAGHFMFNDQPALSLDAVRRFLAGRTVAPIT